MILERLDRLESLIVDKVLPVIGHSLAPPPGLYDFHPWKVAYEPELTSTTSSNEQLQSIIGNVADLGDILEALEKLLVTAPIEHFDKIGQGIGKIMAPRTDQKRNSLPRKHARTIFLKKTIKMYRHFWNQIALK